MKGLRVVAAFVGVVTVGAWLSAGVAAQAPPQAPPAQGRGAGGVRGGGRAQNPAAPPQLTPNMLPQEIERLFDAYELLNAQNVLQLDSQAFLVFYQRFQQYQFVRRQHQGARQKLLNEINTLLKPEANTDETTLNAKTNALDDLELQDAKDEKAALAAVDLTLNVRQRARLRVFINNQEKKKLELITQARMQAQQIKPPPPQIIK